MKTTVYAVRDQTGTRLTYRYRDRREAVEAVRGLAHRRPQARLEVYRTTQDLPAAGRKASRA